MEQVLTMDNGYALTEDDKELGELGVRPGMHLFLSVSLIRFSSLFYSHVFIRVDLNYLT